MDPNLMLYAASYPDEASAQADFESLKAAQGAGEFAIMQAVVITRDADGKVDVKEHGATATKGGAMMGAPPASLSACSPLRFFSPRPRVRRSVRGSATS